MPGPLGSGAAVASSGSDLVVSTGGGASGVPVLSPPGVSVAPVAPVPPVAVAVAVGSSDPSDGSSELFFSLTMDVGWKAVDDGDLVSPASSVDEEQATATRDNGTTKVNSSPNCRFT